MRRKPQHSQLAGIIKSHQLHTQELLTILLMAIAHILPVPQSLEDKDIDERMHSC